MRPGCIVLFLAALWVGRLSAQDAAPLIHEVVLTYKAAKSYHFESDTESSLSSSTRHSWFRSRELLAKDQSGRVRFESLDNSGSYVVVSDGKTLWRAVTDTREFIRTPVTQPILETQGGGPLAEASLNRLKSLMGYNLRLEDNVKKAEHMREETLEVGERQIPCVVVRIDYAYPKITLVESMTRTAWIDKQRHIILQEEIASRGKLDPSKPFEDMESRHMKRYSIAVIDEPLPDSLFAYSPPANFREMDKLQRPYPRPATDLIGKPAPKLSLTSLTGETVNLADLRGKVVLLDFWATWCAPCRRQMTSISKLYQETSDQGLVILGVNDDETPEKALEFLREQHYDWPSLFDGKEKDARSKYKVDAIPTLVVIDKQGMVAAHEIGAGATAEAAIRTALKKQGIELH